MIKLNFTTIKRLFSNGFRNRQSQKKGTRRRRTKQPFRTKRFKFSEDSYLFYWEAAIVVGLIAAFFLVVAILYVIAFRNYLDSVNKKVTNVQSNTVPNANSR